MKIGNILLYAGIAYAVYALSQVGIAANTTQFALAGVDFSSLTNWIITMNVQNVSNANITLNSMNGNITVNGNQLGAISFFPPAPITVQNNSQQNIPINFSPSLISLPGTIMSLINGSAKGGTLTFEITGNANVNGAVIPFDDTVAMDV